MVTVISSVAASAGAVKFPGCDIRREVLEEELRNINDYDHFAWKLSRCPGSTLGEIVSNCNQKTTEAQFAYERWGRFENLWWGLSTMGVVGMICSAAAMAPPPLYLGVGVALAIGSTAAMATGMFGLHMMTHYENQEKLARNVRNEVKDCGAALAARSASTTTTLEDQLRMLDPEEKNRLGASLVEQAQTDKKHEAQPRIVRGDATVTISGVEVPVRQPDAPVSQSQ